MLSFFLINPVSATAICEFFMTIKYGFEVVYGALYAHPVKKRTTTKSILLIFYLFASKIGSNLSTKHTK